MPYEPSWRRATPRRHPVPRRDPARLRRLCLALSALPGLATAQAAPDGAPTTVLVEATRAVVAAPTSPGAVRLQALRAAGSDTAALLRDIPGVGLQGAGGVSGLPSIHGLAGDRVRVQVDGMDLIASCPNHMNPPLSYLDPSQVAMLEVWAGIAPVSAGGDSLGGTIVARTAEPQFAPAGGGALAKGEAGAFARSNGRARGGHLTATYATESLSARYHGAIARAGNYDAGGDFKTSADTGRVGHSLPLDEVGSTAYDTRNHTLALAWRSGEHLLDARLGYQDLPEQLYPNQRMDMLGNTQRRVNLRYVGRIGGATFEARAYGEHVEHFMDFGADKRYWYGTNSGDGAPCAPVRFHGDPAGTCAAGMPMDTESRNHGLTLKAELPLGDASLLRVGSEAQAYRLDDAWPPSGGGMGPGTFTNIADGRRDRLALFGEWQARHGARWTTLVGARIERVTSDAGDVRGYSTAANAPGAQVAEAAAFNALDRRRRDHNRDLAALARWRAGATLDVEFGAARKVRSPNLYERYAWSSWAMAALMNNFVGDGNGYVGNLDLKPEVAYTASATFDWHAEDRHWWLKATPYVTRVSDYVDAVARTGWKPGQFNVLGYANQSARLRGVDLSGRMPLASGAAGDWGVEAVVAYVDGENRDTGDALYQAMPLNARLALTQRRGGWDNSIEWVLVRAKTDGSDVRNEVTTPGYGLLHLRASHTWPRVRVDVGVENLLDKLYFLPTGGAYVGQGRTMSITGAPWGIAVPGPGRSVYTSMTVSF
ncbi:MAG: TonB-dependent receptor [Gammaproteobacteria bacterium]